MHLFGSGDIGDAVELGQLLLTQCVIAIEQVGDGAVFMGDAGDEHLEFRGSRRRADRRRVRRGAE